MQKVVVFGADGAGKTTIIRALCQMASGQMKNEVVPSSSSFPVQITGCELSGNALKGFRFHEVNTSSATTSRLFPTLSVKPRVFLAVFDCMLYSLLQYFQPVSGKQ